MAGPPPTRRPWAIAVAAAIAFGAALRVFQLPSQIVGDDELYSLRAALELPYGSLFDRIAFGYTSIPQTVVARILADTIGLDELTFRLPSLLAGLATLVLVPVLAGRRFGAAAAGVSAGLVAISPQLVFYSRFARAYAATTLLVFGAAMAFERWLEGRRSRDAAAYLACAVAAVWFHLLSAPAVLVLPLVGALGSAVSAAPGRRGPASLPSLLIGASACLFLVALMARPLGWGWWSLSAKLGSGWLQLDTFTGAARHLAGTGSAFLASLFWVGVVAGAVVAVRRRPLLGWLLIASCGAQLAAILVARPFMAQLYSIFARYLTCVLPFCLVFGALAVAELGRIRIRGRDWPLPLATAAVLVAALYRSGPLPAAYRVPNGLTNHSDFQVTYAAERRGRGAGAGAEHGAFSAPFRTAQPDVSEWYRRMRSEPGDFEIVEGPWFGLWELIPFHHYQRVHHRPISVGMVGPLPGVGALRLDDPRLRFRHLVDLREPASLLAAPYRYVVIHKDLFAETGSAVPAFDLAALLDLYRRTLGTPVFEDGAIAVFSTAALRDRAGGGPAAAAQARWGLAQPPSRGDQGAGAAGALAGALAAVASSDAARAPPGALAVGAGTASRYSSEALSSTCPEASTTDTVQSPASAGSSCFVE